MILPPIEDCQERLVSPSPYLVHKKRLLSMLANSCIRSEYEFFKLGFGLHIPYTMLLDILREIHPEPATYTTYMEEVGLHLLHLAQNAFYKNNNVRHLKYFYHVLVPHNVLVPLHYFDELSSAMRTVDGTRLCFWDCLRSESPWVNDETEFVVHFFHLISTLTIGTYTEYSNHRSRLLGHPYETHYAGELLDSPTLSEKYGNLGLINSFFIKFGIIGGNQRLKEIVDDFHHPLCLKVAQMDNLPVPDMPMLAFNGAMKLINEKFGGNMWSFARSFAEVCG